MFWDKNEQLDKKYYYYYYYYYVDSAPASLKVGGGLSSWGPGNNKLPEETQILSWLSFVEDLLGCASRVHNILTTVMTNMVVDKSTKNTKPCSIC